MHRDGELDCLHEIIDILRRQAVHDFTHYKPGTLRRRIAQRMAIVGNEPERYLGLLRSDARERDLLAKDLLINVTSFFRDPKVFDVLAGAIIPDLLARQHLDQTLRIWVAGCSTGEEVYSLAMLFREAIAAKNSAVQLQIIASDVDQDALALARDGVFPATIGADISPARLARFFTKVDGGYRVSPELRAAVVFTAHDVLSGPPFSSIDLVSCRNLLIYLNQGAQDRALTSFHSSLRDGGVLLLGNSETVGNLGVRFEFISKSERLYRQIGSGRLKETGISMMMGDGPTIPVPQDPRSACRATLSSPSFANAW